MKNIKLLIIALALSACHEDNSTLATREISDIAIAALGNESAIAYSGHVLERQPGITTRYAEEQLEHAWYLDKTGYSGDQELIGSEKNLSYEVDLPSGNYTIIYKVSSRENGYTVTATMRLAVTTAFETGFWVFKETADGNTEVDLHTSDTSSMQNLMTKIEGAPLPGAPRAFNMLYELRHIDPANPLAAGNAASIALFTENDEFKIFRARDMARVFDRSNLLFAGPMEPNEIPYNIVRVSGGFHYLSNAGARYSTNSATSNGQMGFPVPAAATTPGANVGGSKYAQLSGGGSVLNYWNEQRHRLESVNAGTLVTELPLDVFGAAVPDRLQVVAHGIVTVPAKMSFFLFQDELTGNRYLSWLDAAGAALHATYGVKALDPTLHLARSNMISANGLSAQLIYCVHENKLWAYDIVAETERELTLPAGIPAGATLSYVANLFQKLSYTAAAFDYIVIGTQEGNNYTLYCYTILGGQPNQLVRTFRGEGRVEKLRYLTTGTLSVLLFTLANPHYPMY
ncbi:MAG: hypothetical protein LBK12_00315 [Odoribacteraceae bacterium]|jgi:hypothetical protein|nr:hypothetical protein [Odoribacteraceae bacterium]